MKTTAGDISGPWHARTANGRLPIVCERKRPHGEASTYEASIGAGDTLCGPLVCKLDFGYGYTSRAEMERVTRLIAAAPSLADEAHHLAMLALQSDRYREDADYSEVVDNILAVLGTIADRKGA